MRITSRDLLLVMVVTLFWGLHAPIMRLGVMTVEPLSLNFVRFLVTGLICLPFASKISRADLVKLIPVSIFFCCVNLMMGHLALARITSNSFIILIQIAQPVTLLLAWLLYREKFGIYTAAGITVSFCGLLIVFGAPDIAASPIGGLFTILAALGWSIGSLFMKRTGHIPPASFLAYSYLMAAPIALAGTLLLETNQIEGYVNADPFNLGFVIFYQVIVMALMSFIWAGLMARNPAQLVTPFLMIQPIFAMIGGYYINGEMLNWNICAGGIVVLLGIGIINWRLITKRKAMAEPTITT